ncbi:MAG TPA: polysaccharide deacetylase family protein [Pyrinomonadaceae bacterium]|nr:polysaccharide deacetylase family protein [Pyrinomonadaceae bacterium]
MKVRQTEPGFIPSIALVALVALMALVAWPSFAFGQRARARDGAHPYTATGASNAPRLFAEGIVNTSADEYGPAFTPDGRTIYFAKRSPDRKMEHIYFSRFGGGRWGAQQLAPFSGKYFDKEPFITPDGAKLFFASTRPLDSSAPAARGDFNLWVVERAATSASAGGEVWGEARPLGAAVNSDTYDNYPSVAANGNLYFSSTRAGGRGSNDLYRARFVGGRYAPAENLLSLNTPASDADPYIAPDESYLIISTTRAGSYGEGDLYVSFNVRGAWTTPRNLGERVNSATYEYTPLVSPDGKYLFFSRGWGDIYQLDASALPLRREAADRIASNAPVRRRVAVTVDDLPFTGDGGKTGIAELRGYTSKLLQTFTAKKIPAIGFVNERKLEREGEREARIGLLKMWTDAGFELGNHTFAHASFYRTPLAAFQQQVIDGEPVTRSLLAARGRRLRYFRHPYLNTGPDIQTKEAFEKFLVARGYRVAPVTIDNAEWIFAAAYAQAAERGDRETAARIADEYVPYMERMFEFYEGMSVELFGREIQQTLLIHANSLNADHFERIAAMLRRRGYEFVTLDEALRDEAYAHRDTYTGATGISWLQRWAITRGGKFRKEPPLPPYMRQFDPAGSGSDFKTAK